MDGSISMPVPPVSREVRSRNWRLQRSNPPVQSTTLVGEVGARQAIQRVDERFQVDIERMFGVQTKQLIGVDLMLPPIGQTGVKVLHRAPIAKIMRGNVGVLGQPLHPLDIRATIPELVGEYIGSN